MSSQIPRKPLNPSILYAHTKDNYICIRGLKYFQLLKAEIPRPNHEVSYKRCFNYVKKAKILHGMNLVNYDIET